MGIPILLIGITMIVVGFAFIPGTRRAVRKVRSILDIIGIRKEVTITEICATTDLEREFVIDVLTKLVMSEHIYGYLEDDLFVRDVSRIRPQDLVDTGPFGDSMNS